MPPGERVFAPLRCPVCTSGALSTFRAACTDRLLETPGAWDILRCDSCGIRFSDYNGSDADLLERYPPEYNAVAPARAARDQRLASVLRRMAMFPYRARYGEPDRVPAPFGGGRALDVGCGTGDYLRRLMARGWRAHGLDFNVQAVEIARRTAPGAVVDHGTLGSARLPDSFAYISLRHVLEHTREPQDVLRRCHKLLEPGGRLSIAVPNIDSCEARLFRTRWRGLDMPRHLVHFSRRTLVELVTRASFRVTLVRPAFFASSLSESLLLMLPAAAKRRAMRNAGVRRAVYLLVLAPASISYAVGNDPVIELDAQKA